MKILIAGATGFVGTYLIDYLLEKGYSINALSRSKKVSHHKNLVYFRWDIHQQYIETIAFENVDTIINLTGANIGEKRWTKERKSEIISSRIKSIDCDTRNFKTLFPNFAKKHLRSTLACATWQTACGSRTPLKIN